MITNFKKSILQQISKSLRGTEVEHSDFGYTFSVTSPYQYKYQIDAIPGGGDKSGTFLTISDTRNLTFVKIINFISLYLILKAMTSNIEIVKSPFFGSQVNAVLFVLFSMVVSLVLMYFEINTGREFSNSLPKLYSMLVQKEAMSILNKNPLEAPDVKDRAKAVLARRNKSVLNAKKEAVEGRLNSVFGEKETIPLDKKSVERMRLMETVKRILNSTPPWTNVSLQEIAKLSKGEEDEVEIIIAGLRDLKEVKGIYDIWTKTYYGTSSTHWLMTKIIKSLPEDNTSLENVKIYPDGGGEFSFKNKDKMEK